MSDELHEDLARRLRAEGSVPAPPDLRSEVMAQVAAEPRRRSPARRQWWRPALAVAAVACGVAGLVIGLSNLGGSASSSSSSGSSAAAALRAPTVAGEASGSAAGPLQSPVTFSVTPKQALRVLGFGALHDLAQSDGQKSAGVPAAGSTYNLYLSPEQFDAVSKKLGAVQSSKSAPGGFVPAGRRVRIILHRKGGP